MLVDWLRRFQKLRVDRASKTPAPHKPLLLLAIIDLVENGDIATPQVRLTPELAFRFLGYWEIVGARGRSVGRVELPFFICKAMAFFAMLPMMVWRPLSAAFVQHLSNYLIASSSMRSYQRLYSP